VCFVGVGEREERKREWQVSIKGERQKTSL
jgi:hypothetical protein